MNPLLRAFRLAGTAPVTVVGLKWSTDIAPFVTAGSAVTIPAGTTVLWDVASTPNLGSVDIQGSLVADLTKDLGLTCTDLMIEAGGTFSIGNALLPYTHNCFVELNGAPTTKTPRPNHPASGINQGYYNDGISRGFNNHGTTYFRGVPKVKPITKLNATVDIGATSATLLGNCGDWLVGEDIIIAPTGFAGQSNPERRTLTSVSYSPPLNTTTVGWTTPLTEAHWGLLQYPIDAPYGTNGMSLTANVVNGPLGGPNTFTPPDADTPTVYDARAEVFNISNGNIQFRAANDGYWNAQGHGIHKMDHPGSQFYELGVRVVRGGQRGVIGRYPNHAHKLSQADISAAVTFTTGAYVKVNWPNHGITRTSVNTGTVTFSNFGGVLFATMTGVDTTGYYNGNPVSFSAGSGTLPSNIVAGQVYLISYQVLGSGSNSFFVATDYTENALAGGAPVVHYVDAGSGTCSIDASVCDQPVAFTTTGTLPFGLSTGSLDTNTFFFNGTFYRVAGPSITTNSFAISVAPPNGTAGSGVHTGKYSVYTSDHPECIRSKCTVDTSENRAFSIHATNGSEISDCIFYDVKGQGALVGEDGSEIRNKYYRNTGMLVRNPVLASDRLKDFDGTQNAVSLPFLQSSAHWFTNPQNDVRNNIGILCDGNGAHNAYALRGFSIATLVNCTPYIAPILRWVGNGGHSNYKRGAMTNSGIGDEFGTGSAPPFATGSRAINALGFQENLMEGGIAWKNRQGGYLNTVNGAGPFYKGWTTGDNDGGDFEGNTSNSVDPARSHLMIGTSLMPVRTGVIAPNDTVGDYTQPIPRFGNATYHFTLFFSNCAFQNYPWVRPYWVRGGQQDYGGGGTSFRDLYTDAVGTQYRFSVQNKFNNSNPGPLSRNQRYAGYPVTLTLANPCVVTPNRTFNAEYTWPEFYAMENEPLYITRSNGTIPSPLSKGLKVFAKNVNGTTGSFQISLTSGGAAISTAGSTQSGTLCMSPMWRDVNLPWKEGQGGAYIPDPYCYWGQGSTGTTPRWVCAYGDNPFFASGAANAFNCEPNDGIFGLGFSTTDPFIGIDTIHTDKTISGNSAGVNRSGMRAVRYNPSDMSVIGTYDLESYQVADGAGFFPDFNSVGIKSGGRYSIKAASDIAAPVSFSGLRLTVANETGVDFMIGIEWGGSTPTTVFRTLGGFGSGMGSSIPFSRITTTGWSVACTAGASLAAAAASSNGSVFWFDASNQLVWVRWVPLPGDASYDAFLASLFNAVPFKGEKPSYFVVQA